MQELCLIGIPRTGTNHLIACLSGLPRVKSLAELFHPKGTWGIWRNDMAALGLKAGQVFREEADPALVEYARANPTELLDMVSTDDGRHALMCFKIFTNHLAFDVIERHLVMRPNLRFVTIKRRFLDSYVSGVKAAKLGVYKHADTTDVQVELDFENFRRLFAMYRDWYVKFDALLKKHDRPIGRLLYEADIDCAIPQMLGAVRRAAGHAGITPDCFDGSSDQALSKQDRSVDYSKRIANWDEFSAKLEQSEMYERAMAYL